MDLPDDLYRQVKVRSALEGRTVRDVTIGLYRRWLAEEATAPRVSGADWLDEWLELGRKMLRDAPPGPTATEILAADRDRLESR